jgi:dUTP pyrophosphatase
MSYILKIKFDKNTPNSIINYYENFTSHHEGDSGIDLIAPNEIQVAGLNVGTIDHLIQCEMINEDNKNVSYYLYPRSSISKTNFMMANSVGIIDAGYRGNIMAKVRNMSLNENEFSIIKENDKLFQICAPDLKPIKIKIVNELSDTSRGSGGFGSTN